MLKIKLKLFFTTLLLTSLMNAQVNYGGLKSKLERETKQEVRESKNNKNINKEKKAKEENTTGNEISSNKKSNNLAETNKQVHNSMNTITGEVVFSNEPFIGDKPANKIVNEFKAWDEIYGRINFDKPIAEILDGSNIAKKDDGSILVAFEVVEDASGKNTIRVTKYLTKQEMEKNYFDFDIAPALNTSRDNYIVSFSSAFASYGLDYFKERAKGKFTFYVFFQDRTHENMEGQNNVGNLTVDYSNLPDGDKGTTKIKDWSQKIDQAANDDVVKENKKKMEAKNSGTNPAFIFTNTAGKTANVFQAGEEIHGKLILQKPLKDYLSGDKATQIQIDIKCLNDNITTISVIKILRPSEFNNSYIEFDVFPTLQNAKDVYDNNLGFYRTFYGNAHPKKIVNFELSLATDYNLNYNGFKKLEALGEIAIDYTKATKEQIEIFYNKGQQAGEEAEKNAEKLYIKESAETVKTMPLPIVFTRSSKAGYSSYSNTTLINIIKSRFKITEVFMLTFDEAEGSGDFTPLKDLNNYPTEKIGNHVFYFSFKDPIDGHYKFTGGRLRMLYEGNGKYSEPFVFPYSPIMNGDPKYPFDYGRYDQGFESVFFIDGEKIKK
ncbi:MAG: hypothetical protein H0W73_09860 [Bacteroidetes bacterium]|nr:hypothetical protein [Bacteroidota bacterium]